MSLMCCSERATPRTRSRSLETLFQPPKVSLTHVLVLLRILIAAVSEWTFAKQKWQRTKNVPTNDPKHGTAVILPGFQEQLYA